MCCHVTAGPPADLPVAGGRYEVQAAVDSVVRHGPPVHPRLCVQEVLALAVDVVDDRLPAGDGEKKATR